MKKRISKNVLCVALRACVAVVVAGVATAAAAPADAESGHSADTAYFWLLVAIAVMTLINLLKPSPPLHKEYANKEETADALKSIEGKIDAQTKKMEEWSSAQYRSRKEMHGQINVLEKALAFMAGKWARSNDPDADRLTRILESKPQGGAGHE